MDRREFLKKSTIAASIPLALSACSQTSALSSATSQKLKNFLRQPGKLSWLEGQQTAYKPGSTWGKPWAQGELSKTQALK
ncbi:hypothetical protein N7931_16685, partial [Catenovulum sp. 2E275]|uniref:RIFT barrel domain-containing protein n=1 Tax=Catenovulum sp. 2E275 TaxID=2980497 RepID=UPI0021D390CD